MSVRHLVHVVGLILVALSAALGATTLVALYYGDGDFLAFLASTLITAAAGLMAARRTSLARELTVREGYAVVSLAWIATGVAGALPFLLAGATPSPVAALFESMSGFTTTGASVFTDIEALPHGILFWRNLTQWIGGMGIIVLGIAILPFLGVGGMQLFRAEVPGPTPERLQPRIAQTAKLLWYVYLGLTTLQVVLYLFGGLSVFDAVTHAFTTLSTGGFSTRNASLAAFPPYAQYVTILFMFLAGINFALHYRAFTGHPVRYLRDPELRFFAGVLAGATLLVLVVVWSAGAVGAPGPEVVFRHSLFQVVSIATTTGFVTFDYELWPVGGQLVLLLLMFMGGMAGSTSGGMKTIRVYVLVRHGLTEMKKSVHPRAVTVTRVGRQALRDDVVLNIFAFVLLYVGLFAAGSLVMALLGHDLVTAIGASAATIGNIGPGLGGVGAVDNYGWMGPVSQLALIFLMLVGRLEIFTVLLLFHPDLWRRYGAGSGD
ncbi:MAG TPA: TrkH family potassium uptake protein [Longimicrobiales bacterium]|nr:TrkH family potassium uptake protein [Longimicrobiales bacterium]